MGEIKYKNGEITIDESIVKQLRYTEGKCIIHVSCENKFEGPPEKLAIFVCNSLSKELGREVILNIMNISPVIEPENGSNLLIYIIDKSKKLW